MFLVFDESGEIEERLDLLIDRAKYYGERSELLTDLEELREMVVEEKKRSVEALSYD